MTNLKQRALISQELVIKHFIALYFEKDVINYSSENIQTLLKTISDKFKITKEQANNIFKKFLIDYPLISKIIDNFNSLYPAVIDYDKVIQNKKIPINEKFFNTLSDRVNSEKYNSEEQVKPYFFYLYFCQKYD